MPAGAGLAVVGRALVRVLAVGELALPRERKRDPRREALAIGEPGRDRRLVGRGGRERLGGKRPTRLERQVTAPLELGQDRVVLRGRADRNHVGEVLRRRPEQRRPADVDHLDGLLLARVLAPGDRVERVEVHADEVDRLDVVLGERRHVVRPIPTGQDARMDARVERLHATAEQLGELRELVDPPQVDADLGQP